MLNSNKHFVNAFTNKLYNTIYAEMSKNNNYLTNTDNKLESLQKEQFITLFIELKIKNEPLDVNSVMRICHKFLEQTQSSASTLQVSNQIIDPDEFVDLEQQCLHSDKTMKNKTVPSSSPLCNDMGDRITLGRNNLDWMTLSKDERTRFGRELLLNLTRYSQGGVESLKMDTHVYETFPNLKFIVTHLSELGRLLNIIKGYVNVDHENCGRVVKALKFVLQKEIDSYYIYANVLLHDILGHPNDLSNKYIPLDHNFLIRFQFYANVVNNDEGKKGCNLISSLVHYGISEIETAILNEIAKPIQAMIVRWMIDGEVHDKYEEFFIVKNSSENYWDDNYTISSKNTLIFLNKYQLNDIYQTGNNMNLLKVLDLKTNNKIQKLIEDIKELAYEDELLIKLADKYSKISTTVSEVCARSEVLLMEVLTDKYNLFEHFKGFRDYMLLGRGDFYTHVIFELEPYFENSQMKYYQLEDAVKNAYNLTSTRNSDKKLFDNFKYSIEINEKVNWNSFKFNYVTDESLNKIFGPFCNHYANVFEFLWRLKKLDWTTSNMWHKQMYFSKKSYHIIGIEIDPVLRNINLLLSSMISCVKGIQNFMFRLIDNEWKRFEIETYGAIRIKTVTDAHMSILQSLDDASMPINAYVELLNANIEKFANISQRFVDVMTKISSSVNPKIGSREKYIEEIDAFLNNFKDLKNSYEEGLCEFLSKLVDTETRGLVTLALMINFSGYYIARIPQSESYILNMAVPHT